LDVENRITRIALRKDDATLRKRHNFSALPDVSEEHLRIEE
jgi:hypothetical protein